MPFQLPQFVSNLFRKASLQQTEQMDRSVEASHGDDDIQMFVANDEMLQEPERIIKGSSEEVLANNETSETSQELMTGDEVEDGEVIELEENRTIEASDSLASSEFELIEGADAYLVGEEGEVIQIVEGDEFLAFEDGELTEGGIDPFTGAEFSHGDLIDEAQVIETVVGDTNDDGIGTIGQYGEEDNEKENGYLAQQEFQDDSAGERIVEVARRRLSHEGNCYCGKDRNLNIAELLCASCHRWYHESCIGYQLGKLVPFMMNYIFICKNCSPTGLESFKRTQAQIVQMCVTAIANLTQASVKDGSNRHKFSKEMDIIPFIDMHWEGMTPTRRVSQSWQSAVARTLFKETDLFVIDSEPRNSNSPYFGLLAMDLNQIRPNYEAMIKSGILKLNELIMVRRSGGKRRTVDGAEIFAQSQAAVAKKMRGDSFLAKTIIGFGYPSEHPFNKDGYRYVLAEPDSNAPFRQEFDESSDLAGKPIPGWLYRVFNPPFVLLALHDRAPQLKISEDRLSVTGDKGYCTIRATHCVTKGIWYWEAKITELPESAACRIGWGQSFANLQAPLGFDKFGYSWRSRLGTQFHQAVGKSYCKGGYGLGDILGFLIALPEPEGYSVKRFSPTDPTSVPDSFKDRPLVRFKSHLYYEDKDLSGEVDVTETRRRSKIICFKNGICQGIAYIDLYEGSYYPAISLYKGCTVKANFGPNFEYPPSKCDYLYKSFQERAEEAVIEQTMSDMLFLTENYGELNLENPVPIPQ